MGDAQPLDQALLVAQRTERSHEPAVAIPALPHVIRRRAVNVQLRVVKDVHHALGAPRLEVVAGLLDAFDVHAPQGLQTVAAAELEVGLEIKARVAVLPVDAAALAHNLVDFGAALGGGIVVRGLGRTADWHRC